MRLPGKESLLMGSPITINGTNQLRIYYKGWEGKTLKVTHNSQVTNGKEVLYKTLIGREGGREGEATL